MLREVMGTVKFVRVQKHLRLALGNERVVYEVRYTLNTNVFPHWGME